MAKQAQSMTWQIVWRPQLDNPNFLGWSVVAAYALASFACGWVAVKSPDSALEGRRVWWVLSAVLLFLGINKQLNLQTLLIDVGRNAATDAGWYGRRRLIQAAFSTAFALFGLGLLWLFASQAKSFIVKNRLAFAGVIVLLVFVVLRSSTINHADERFGLRLNDDQWAWVLELCGSILITLSAIAAANSAALREKSKA